MKIILDFGTNVQISNSFESAVLYVSKFPTQTAVLLVKVLSGHKKTEICGHTSTRGISHPFVLL